MIQPIVTIPINLEKIYNLDDPDLRGDNIVFTGAMAIYVVDEADNVGVVLTTDEWAQVAIVKTEDYNGSIEIK